jgi:ribosomal protein L12E/L44/L45/RPP1/RPP2
MTKDPWTNPDPQRGDFDAYLKTVDPREIEIHEGNPDARVTTIVNVSGEDARRLERIAELRGQNVDEVIPDLLREAEQHTV